MFAEDRALDQTSMAEKLEQQRARQIRREKATHAPSLPVVQGERTPSRDGNRHPGLKASGGETQDNELDEQHDVVPPLPIYDPIVYIRSRTRSTDPSDDSSEPKSETWGSKLYNGSHVTNSRDGSIRRQGSQDSFSSGSARLRPAERRRTPRDGTSGTPESRSDDFSWTHKRRGFRKPQYVDRSHGRRTDRSSNRPTGVVASIEQDPRDPECDSECDFCGADLLNDTIYRCRDCPFVLCSICISNVSVTHRRHRSTHRCNDIRLDPKPSDDKIPSSSNQNMETPGHFLCFFCARKLTHVRYECEQCPGVNLCAEDRDFHIVGHVLKPIHMNDSPPTVSTDHRTKEIRGWKGIDVSDSMDWWVWDEQTASPSEGRYQTRNSKLRDTTRDTGSGGKSDEENKSNADNKSDAETWNGFSEDEDSEASDSSPRQRNRNKRPRRAARTLPTEVTLPIDGGSASLVKWAKAILAQFPDPEHEEGQNRRRGRPRSRPRSREPRVKRAWKPSDRRQLRQLKAEGRPNSEIADLLGRTEGAILQQWRKMDG